MTAWPHDIILAAHREAGWPTIEHPGWERHAGRIFRARGYEHGVQAIGLHHTAQPQSQTDTNAIGYMFREGIGNVYLAKDGTAVLLAGGPSYTQGRKTGGSPLRGNPDHWSVEIANDGIGEAYTEPQERYVLEVVPRLLARFAEVYGWSAEVKPGALPWWRLPAHFEWAPGRKIDPRGGSRWSPGGGMWDMDAVRRDVLERLPVPVPPPGEGDDMQLVDPSRARWADTRAGTQFDQSVGLRQPGTLWVPAKHPDVPVGARAVWVRVTSVTTEDTPGGWVTCWPSGTRPETTQHNWPAGTARGLGSLACVPVSPQTGTMVVQVSAPCHLVLDVVGWER